MANKCKYKNSGNAESLPTGHPNDLKHFHDKVLSSFITLKAQHFYFLLFWLRNKSSKIPFRLPRRESWLANMGWRTIMQKWHLIQNHRCDKLKVLTVNPLLSPPPPPSQISPLLLRDLRRENRFAFPDQFKNFIRWNFGAKGREYKHLSNATGIQKFRQEAALPRNAALDSKWKSRLMLDS